MNYLKLDECQIRAVYRVHSRNLTFGAFDGNDGFVGIRTKFNSRFLFTEYHYNALAFATVRPLEKVGEVPASISLDLSFGAMNEIDQRPLVFEGIAAQGGKGWCDARTGEPVEDARPVSIPNLELFRFLDTFTDSPKLL